MQLERVKIKNYKCLKEVDIEFHRPDAEPNPTSTHLLVGVNGTGKSCFLEALGLIFTGISQGEAPGFPFELRYQIEQRQRRVQIRVCPAKKNAQDKLDVTITDMENGRLERLNRVPEECCPRRIITYCSGSNNLMEHALLSSPRACLVSDIYDASFLDEDARTREMSLLMEQYQLLDQNPGVLYLDSGLAKLVIPVLFAILPDFRDPEKAAQYCGLREELTSRVGSVIDPVACSVTVDEEALQFCMEQYQKSPQYEILSRLLQAGEGEGEALNDWAVSRAPVMSQRPYSDEGRQHTERTAVFCYQRRDPEHQNSSWHEKLTEECGGDPMYLLSILLTAQRAGVLTGIQCAFRRNGCKTLLGMESFSDGELIWLAQMGLVLMSRVFSSSNTLFLLDEPDVHFNDDWNKDFINTLQRFSRYEGQSLEHEFIISTHSTLLMTDAYQEQVTLFSVDPYRGTEVQAAPISAFAAERDEISRWLFDAASIGTYAQERVNRELKEADTPESLHKILKATGPGYERFRLYERFFELRDQRENRRGE